MTDDSAPPFRRRKRYRGTHPRRFDEKYKELDPDVDPDTIAKVIASGKTPAGQHRPILVTEILEHLAPKPGQRGADVTFGYGGHSEALLEKLKPRGAVAGTRRRHKTVTQIRGAPAKPGV